MITGPAGWLVSRVLHIKRTYKTYAGLDACMANLMRPALYGAYHHISVVGKENAPATPCTTSPARCARTTTSSPSTGCCHASNPATVSSSTHRRPRPCHGLQLQREAPLPGVAHPRRRSSAAHPTRRNARRPLRHARLGSRRADAHRDVPDFAPKAPYEMSLLPLRRLLRMMRQRWMRVTPGRMRNMRCSSCGAEFTQWMGFIPLRHALAQADQTLARGAAACALHLAGLSSPLLSLLLQP